MLTKDRYVALDGLRGVAAVAVLFYHIDARLMPAGYLAVDLFFVLSGFVIAAAYDKRLQLGMTVSQFFILRLKRFYPLYICGYLIALMLLLSSIRVQGGVLPLHVDRLHSIVSGLLMLPEPLSQKFLYPLNPVAWSLLAEMVINLLFAATWRFWSQRSIAAMCAVTGAALLVAVWQRGEYHLGFDWDGWHIGFLRACLLFPMGVFIRRHMARVPGARWRGEWSIAAIIVAASVFFGFPVRWVPTDLLASLLVFPALTWIAVRSEPPAALGGFFTWGGDVSYGLYATHYPLISICGVMLPRLRLNWLPPLASSMLIAAFCLSIAFVLHYKVDLPLRAHPVTGR